MIRTEEKELILHIGQSKTGTTTLQQTLTRNRKFLETKGILYPIQSGQYNHKLLVPLWSRRSVQGAIQRLDLGSVEDQIKFAEQKWPEVMERFSLPHIRQLVISSELMFDRSALTNISHLKSAMTDANARIKVVAYVREPTAALLSGVQQSLKKVGTIGIPPRNRLENCISAYKNADLGELHIEKFGREDLLNGNIVDDFCTKFLPDVQTRNLRPSADAKVSFSTEGMALLQAQNRGDKDLNFLNSQRRRKRDNFLMAHEEKVPGYTRPKLHDQIRDAYAAYVTDYDWLAEHYQIEFPKVDRSRMSVADAEKVLKSIVDVRDLCPVDEDRLQALKQSLCENKRSYMRKGSFTKNLKEILNI